MFKKFLSLLLVLVMVLSMAPVSIAAEGNVENENSVSAYFTAVDAVNGKIVYERKQLTVTPGLAKTYLGVEYGVTNFTNAEVGENDVTPIDVLVAAHIDNYGAAFTTETAANYIGATQPGYIEGMFEVPGQNTWEVNGVMPVMEDGMNGYAINQYIVQPGDEIACYWIDYNASPANVYASFDKKEAEITVGQELSLKLGFCATMVYEEEPFAAAYADIYMLNAENGTIGDKTDWTTNANGEVTVSFDTAGTYYLTCKGEVDYYDSMWGMDSTGALSPAYCKVTVTEAAAPEEPAEPTVINMGGIKKPIIYGYIDTITISEDVQVEYYELFPVVGRDLTVNIYLAADTEENASFDITLTHKADVNPTAPFQFAGDLGDDGTGTVTLDGKTKTVSILATAHYYSAYTGTIKLNFAPYVAPTSIELNKSALELNARYSEVLTATIGSEGSSVTKAVWTSSDETVAKVSSTGNVYGVKAGTAVITAKAGDLTATCTVTVNEVPVDIITLDKTALSLPLNGTDKLKATIEPTTATENQATWSSSNETVATVDQSGNIKALAYGETTITAKAGDKEATCVVTVAELAPVLSSGIQAVNDVYLAVGETYTLSLNDSKIFTDPEGQAMTYTLSVNGGEAAAVDAVYYTYTPTELGKTTLVFKAQDDKGNESPTYTVNVHVLELKKLSTGDTDYEYWNVNIEYFEINAEKLVADTTGEVDAYVLLDSNTDKDAVFVRVGLLRDPRKFEGMTVNGQTVEGSYNKDAKTWSGVIPLTWNAQNEAEAKFVALPQSNNLYSHTLRFKLDDANNTAPGFKNGAAGTAAVMQYFDHTVDLKSIFTDTTDNWLFYSVDAGDGEFVPCGDSYVFNSQTTGQKVLKFKATDLAGKESEVYTLTITVSDYATPAGSYGIGDTNNDGGVLSVTIQDDKGNAIQGAEVSVGEKKAETETMNEGRTDEGSYTIYRRVIDVTLPGNEGQVKTTDTIQAYFHLAQNENGWPVFTSSSALMGPTDDCWDAEGKITDTITTKLNGGLGTGYGYLYEKAPTLGSSEAGWNNERIVYELRYHIERDNNQAPQLKAGVTSPVEVTQEQYTSYSLNAKNFLTDPEGDKTTYYISIGGGAFEEFNGSRTFNLDESGTTRIVVKATDALGAESAPVTIYLTATEVIRHIIQTGDTGYFNLGGAITDITIRDQRVEKSVVSKTNANHRYVLVQLQESVADNAKLKIEYTFPGAEYATTGGYNGGVTLLPGNTITLVDGEATAQLVCRGNFFYKTVITYDFVFTKEANHAPALAEGVEAAVDATVFNSKTYSLDLDSIFTDADGDELTYTVSVNGAAAVAADADYSYIPAELGTYTLVFRAADMWGTADATHTVNLTAKNADELNTVTFKVPKDVTPVFYGSTGYDENYQDILSTQLNAVAGATADGWTTYTVSVPDNFRRVSFRGTVGETAWGGMSVAVKDVEDNVITEPFVLRQLEGIINTKLDGNVAPTAQQAVFQVKYGEGAYAVTGGTFSDQYGNLGYRFLLLAADNSLVYTHYAEPLGDLANTYATAQGDVKTVTTEASAKATSVMKLANKSAFKITAPEAAKVQMFQQRGNYNVIEIPAYGTESNGDGTKTVTFNVNNGMWRVSMDDKITKAGYCEGDSVTVTWGENDPAPNHRADYDLSTNLGNRGNDSMYVNVNYRNNLRLDVDETFRLRSYRIWEIINTDTANIMIEPDFHYNVISGGDVIEITTPNVCSGNATGNWLDIKGKQAGTAVVEITYDAIHLMTNPDIVLSTGSNFIYNAVDPARTALIVVQVGAAENDIDFGIRNNAGSVWDAEHDTLCFTGESAELKFKPTAASGTISKVEVSGNKGLDWTELPGVDGEYTATIVHGNNIVRVTKDDGSVSHQLVRGYKLTVVVTEVQGKSNLNGTVEPGETVSLWLKGYHNPVGKMSGIYNSQVVTLHFMIGENKVSRACGAYGFYGDARINVMIPGTAVSGEIITLEDGYATNSGYGSASAAHREVGGEVPPNLDAGTTGGGFNIYDDITITVGASTQVEEVEATGITLNQATASVEMGKSITLTATVTPSNATDKTVTWSSDDTSVASVSASGKVTGVAVGTATITATIGAFSDTCTVTVTEATGGNTPSNPELEFGLKAEEILGYVTVSFEDNGSRLPEELNLMAEEFRRPLGTIIPATQVPYKAYDTIASVTLRLLEEKGFMASYEGDEYSSFYLAAIGDFTHRNTYYASMGQFNAGEGSGWMITWDDWFINKGASEFQVTDGDVVRWQFTCQYGKDIGDPFYEMEGGMAGKPAAGTTEETLTPEVEADENGNAKAEISADTVEKALESTEDSALVVEPVVKGEATSVSVSLPAEAVEKLAESEKDLTVKTENASVTLDNQALTDLSGEATVSVEKSTDGTVKIDVTTADGKTVDADVAVTLPAEATSAASVLVIVAEDGTETIVKKSLATEEGLIAQIPAGSTVKVIENTQEYTDLDHWGKDALQFVSARGIFEGDGSLMMPEHKMTRAMMVTTLFRLEDGVKDEDHNFIDVTDGLWYSDAVAWAFETGITEGDNGKFDPNREMTREEMVTMLYRYAKIVGIDTETTDKLTDFEDADTVSSWAEEAMAWAVGMGLIEGRDGLLAPDGTAKRAEVATVYQRLIEAILS